MRWMQTHNGIVAYGSVKHKVWPAAVTGGFYAKSGLDTHGPYQSAKEAQAACVAIESSTQSPQIAHDD